MAAFTITFLVGACGPEQPIGTVGYVEGFFGAVVADEPRAALVGRDVLSAGGTAADAVTAMYFAAAATFPSSASLGGGGVCMGFDAVRGGVDTIDFIARSPVRVPPDADRPSAVPGNVRGFFAFHARFGRLSWSQLLAPAENFARFGFRVSRAFANDISVVDRALRADPETLRVLAASGGTRLVGEGDFLRQVELAAVLGRVRSEGAGAFYTGPFASQFAEAARNAGGSLEVEDLRNYRPSWLSSLSVPFGDDVAHFAPPPAAGGVPAAQIWWILVEESRGDSDAERLAQLVEASRTAALDRSRWMQPGGNSSVPAEELVSEARMESLVSDGRSAVPASNFTEPALENPAAATFVAVDREGSAAACAVTLNGLFGTGRVAPGTGIVLAAAPGPRGRGATALGPMLVVNEVNNKLFFAGVSAGGLAAPPALASIAARVLDGEDTLSSALAAPRAIGTRVTGLALAERSAESVAGDALRSEGFRLVPVDPLGRVNAVACPLGIPPYPESCTVGKDPRGFGLSSMAD